MPVCANPQCRRSNESAAPYCAYCGQSFPEPETTTIAFDEGVPPARVERARNPFAFYLMIWIPVSIAIVLILNFC